MNSIIIGQRWESRATGFEATVLRIGRDGTVTYAWIEFAPDADPIGGRLDRATFLDVFRPV